MFDDDDDEEGNSRQPLELDGRHPESHKTLALRSQNTLPRAAHPSWP